MMPNDKDAFGDGHGFRVPERKTVTIKVAPYKFEYDLQGLDAFARGEEFIGLYDINGVKMVRILFRAKQRSAGFRFLTRHGSEEPHYIQDPIAWARLPAP